MRPITTASVLSASVCGALLVCCAGGADKTKAISLRTGDVEDAATANATVLATTPPAVVAATGPSGPAYDLPGSLVEVGLFDGGQINKPVAGVVPYNVKVSLWSDGAFKSRFVFIPPGAPVSFDPGSNLLLFPKGTIVMKHFARDAANKLPLETRVIKIQPDGTYSYASYQWLPDGTTKRVTDATIVPASGKYPAYRIPSQDDCQLCHNPASNNNVLLGTQADELNFTLPNGSNQLDLLVKAGIIDAGAAKTAIASRPPRVDPNDTTLTLDKRTRAYMDLNCGTCHNPNGTVSVIDLTASGDPNLLVQDQVLVLGDAANSLMAVRATKFLPDYGNTHMPPQSVVQDPLAAELIPAWVNSLGKKAVATATETATATASATATATATETATSSGTGTDTSTDTSGTTSTGTGTGTGS